ncbi:MAG TPA: helix-turn-helix domain-containing protein, partial [Pirellulales bacterium]
VMKRFDPSRRDFSPYGFACELWTPARMSRANRHNEIELNFLTSGSLTYLLGGRRTTVPTGRLAVFWAAIPHQIVDFSGDAPYSVLTLPLTEFLHMGLGSHFTNRLLRGELMLDPDVDECDALKFAQWERELREREPLGETATRLEVQARLTRLARRCGHRATGFRSAASLSRADQIACHIARNYHKPLTAQSIAATIGVHPNYAMSLFRETFDMTMTTFITEHRVSHAQRLLATTLAPILNIAHASGFQSLSRFNEAFKAACGCSPRDYRKTHSQR